MTEYTICHYFFFQEMSLSIMSQYQKSKGFNISTLFNEILGVGRHLIGLLQRRGTTRLGRFGDSYSSDTMAMHHG
jgi:hypothetical protein